MQKKQFTLNKIIIRAAMTFAIAVSCVFMSITSAYAGNTNQSESELKDILNYKCAIYQTNSPAGLINEGLIDEIGSINDWYIIALGQIGTDADYSSYKSKFLEYIKTAGSDNVSALRHALVLNAIGENDNNFITEAVNNAIKRDDIMSLIYGLHLYNNGINEGELSKEDIIGALLEKRLDDGGWSLNGNECDTDVTAMAFQALYPNLGDEIIDVINLLASKQLDNAGYESMGVENPESTCQVVIALTTAGINPCFDERFIKNGRSVFDFISEYKLKDGSYVHMHNETCANEIATEQVFLAYASVFRLDNNKGPLLIMDKEAWLSNIADYESEGLDTPKANNANSFYLFFTERTTRLKVIIWIVIAALVAVLCLIMLVLKKKSIKNYIFIVCVGITLSVIVLFLNIKTKDEYAHASNNMGEEIGTVTLTIRCDTIAGVDNKYVPDDGVILAETDYAIYENCSVYDILVEATRENGIQMENTGFDGGVHGQIYIAGINYLYERQYGNLSGWIYRVNGEVPSYGCGNYILSDGDRIEWLYTRELGNDLE